MKDEVTHYIFLLTNPFSCATQIC